MNDAPGIAPVPRLALRLVEVAAAIGVSRRTLCEWLARRAFPAPDLRRGRVMRWRVETVRAWLAANGESPDVADVLGQNAPV